MYCLTGSKSDLKGDKCWKSNKVTASKAGEMKTVFFMFRKIRKSLVSAVLEGRSGQYGLKKKKTITNFFFFTEQFQFLVNWWQGYRFNAKQEDSL